MRIVVSSTVGLAILVAVAHGAGQQTISYQGSLLRPGGAPVPDGTYRMRFKLFTTETGGSPSWQEEHNVQVTHGLFSVILGETDPLYTLFIYVPDLWMEVVADVDRSGGLDGDEVFSPRQKLAGAPWSVPRIEPKVYSPNLIAGYGGNQVREGVYGATIAGGGDVSLTNRVSDHYGTVSGGAGNLAGDDAGTTWDADSATVGGGANNDAAGRYTTVGGGCYNRATNESATVSGGYGNRAYGRFATVAGGRSNRAQGEYSFAAGRRANAEHNGSFVWADSTNANYHSVRDDNVSFRANGGVRFDLNNGHSIDFYDNGVNLIYVDPSTARLTIGGTWVNASDRDSKQDFVPVDSREVLEKLARMPIGTWTYKVEPSSIRHMGPTAQDFYGAFGLGDSDKSITTIDGDGVALAAIQGLYQLVKEKDARIAELEARLARVERLLAEKAPPFAGGE